MKSGILKIALVHEFLVQEGGAEKVLEVLASMFPDAPIYTLITDPQKAGRLFTKHKIIASYLKKYPLSKKKYQWLLPLMPKAIESFDFSDYDVVISSSSAFAKGIKTDKNTLHICYCHTPTRYLWTDEKQYIKELRVPGLIKKMLPPLLEKMRTWDYNAAQRPDVMIANSKTVQKRIKRYYDRNSIVVYPPVITQAASDSAKEGMYYLAGGRLVGYKRFDLVIQAFNKTRLPLKVFGTGPLLQFLKKQSNKNIEFVGWVDDKKRAELYGNALAFINPQIEDFGITMVEALSAGCPVIAYKAGGAEEIVKENVNGFLFDEQSWEALAETIVESDVSTLDKNIVKKSADIFSEQVFKEKINEIIETHVNKNSN